ncbi:MAG TPA: lipopolysaccharide heptosyltransferase II [Bacillota bacterium]|jgi:heptosyltransferase-2|nr:lipopolysaccharide heptosyltransferase II [Bacillota bacterium]HOL08710.1 lipopolysaccharide heptosyltransferase II [Bacillota bacterium]HPO96387.1 lipopolysaccharide heptosyltransferase II [Bacillota bacterium]
MKILLINLMYIGDLLFSTPLIHSLKSVNPDNTIDIIIDEKYLEIVKFNPYLNSVIPINRSSFSNNPKRNLQFIAKIRKERYDLALNLHYNERTTMFTAFSGAKIRTGFAKSGPYSLFYNKRIKVNPNQHKADEYLEILNHLGFEPIPNIGLEMFVDERSQAEADLMWTSAGLQSKNGIIGINAGGNWQTKRWPEANFAQLVTQLDKEGLTPVFFGGPMDKPYVTNILQQTSVQPVVFTGKISLLHLAAMIKKCDVFISGDSGPMHIAASQQTPIVAIYGPTDPQFFGPYKVKHQIVKNELPCSGCNRKTCVRHACMKSIIPEQVLKATIQLLQSNHDELIKKLG